MHTLTWQAMYQGVREHGCANQAIAVYVGVFD